MTDKTKKITAVALLALLIGSLLIRVHLYRKVVYGYQRLTETTDITERAKITKSNERIVGRAHYPYDRLERRPYFPRFWDEYNDYGIMALYNDRIED